MYGELGMKFASIIFVAALALVLQGGFAAAHATAISGHCAGTTLTEFISSDVHDSTNSTSFVNLTDAKLSFTTSASGCVIITFSGVAVVLPVSGSYQYLNVRTLLDRHSDCAPGNNSNVFLATGDVEPTSANSITRVCKNVAPGAHTLQVQYRSTNGGYVQISGHVLTVMHN